MLEADVLHHGKTSPHEGLVLLPPVRPRRHALRLAIACRKYTVSFDLLLALLFRSFFGLFVHPVHARRAVPPPGAASRPRYHVAGWRLNEAPGNPCPGGVRRMQGSAG